MTNTWKFDLQAFITGDEKELELIYFEFSDMLYHLCKQYIEDKLVIEEIVQDTFLKLWEVKEGLITELSVKNYLYTIAKNKCLMLLRQKRVDIKSTNRLQYLEANFNYEVLNSMADSVIEFEELKSKIEKAIEKLPDKLKQVFVMNRVEEMKYKEIAEHLNVSVKTVEVRMSKTLKLLKSDLKDYLPTLYLLCFMLCKYLLI